MLIFNKVGTKHKSYIERFNKKVSHLNFFEIDIIDTHAINLMSGKKILDSFTSKTTYDQYINTLISFGMIKGTTRGFEIVYKKFDWKKATDFIFKKSNNKKIQVLRDSRKISFLASLNLLKDDTFPIKVTRRRGVFKIEDAISESSMWEEESLKSLSRVNEIIRRIKDEYEI